MIAALVLAALLGGYPHAADYSWMKGNGAPFIRADGSLDSALVRRQAWSDYVIWDASPVLRFPQLASCLRYYNPRVTLLGYVVPGLVWNDWWATDAAHALWQAVFWSDGILACRTERPCRFCNADLGNPRTALAMADTILERVVKPGIFDGLLLDVWCAQMHGAIAGEDTVDLGGMGYQDARDWNEAWRAGHWLMAARIRMGADELASGKAAAGDVSSHVRSGGAVLLDTRAPRNTTLPNAQAKTAPFLLIGNCGAGGERDLLSGWMRENFPFQNGGTWAANMLGDPMYGPGYLSDDSLYQSPALSWLVSEPSGSASETARRFRFGLGSASLGGSSRGIGVFSWCRCEWTPRVFRWCPELSVTPAGQATNDDRCKGWLGEPRGPWRVTDRGLYVRDFDFGMILLNPTARWLSYYGTETLRRISGAWGSAFSVPPNDALFLVRTR